ncbi:GNAT family N-acetyltransferase [Erwiniaceae bacterium BAC15a-03b]|uniref:GNAT family N-acetyltransferase n=1 Tax=Winslowiella arboricola TaxID=2978220 RepID=A0A9J6PK88_9GAMM|nr:GNAT family N-acetyltransferase [Winslowiella arboricola]MCU5773138.1 GNAT family N-acetyltransferase [Winslowiella arboricola]MCU5778721.1 GNAT family N-acetyltransferase [Winslowiella arboricola]
MSQTQFRELSPEAEELQPILSGLFGEYEARYGDFFSAQKEQELTEWYLPPQGLFIVLERDGEIIAMGAYKAYDAQTAELKRIWTRQDVRRQGLALVVVQELERRAQLAGYQQIFLTTGFRQPEAVRLYLAHGYQPQFDITRDPESYALPPYDGRLRFTKPLTVAANAHAS